jgi:type III restriction enzyme
MGIDHAYEPDFLVRLTNNVTLLVEVKGYEDDVTRAKHNAAKRWVGAVNNWGQLGKWDFHVNKNPQLPGRELEFIALNPSQRSE